VEPVTTETLEKVLAVERPDALRHTLGRQTAVNAAGAHHDRGA
jgi:carbamoyl-phosphate synthase large subunit